jgi:class 3 adenylate cyclase
VGTYYFSSDVNTLVIIPIEKMVRLVKEISKNPLGVEYTMLGEEDGFLEGMETTLLLQTINKIGGLMRVGFGEAGASVIAKNLSDSGSSGGGKLNLMGSGTLIRSIFGFCDVRNFTDTTECLQEEVMLFVNRIAHILHGIVSQCSGSANKNIGDAFLLTWKLEEGLPSTVISALADQALLSFLKALIELNRYQEFICNFSITATNRLYKRFPGYRVRVGSGLHVGWAVEGAIGSALKIDVTYLSPHVGMSEYLESSTKTYGVPLLLSEAFYKLLSPAAARYCRQVDRVRRGEVEEPFGLFAYDCDVNLEFPLPDTEASLLRAQRNKRKLIDTRKSSVLTGSRGGGKVSGSGQHHPHSPHPHPHPPQLSSVASLSRSESKTQDPHSSSTESHQARGERGGEAGGTGAGGGGKKEEELKPTVVVSRYLESVWETDEDLVRLRHLVNDDFRRLWREGMVAYIKGDWTKAKAVFKETLRSSNGEDGPSKFLVTLIEEHGGMPPRDWEGYHEG